MLKTIVLFLAASFSCPAITQQLIMGGSITSTITSNATTYYAVQGMQSAGTAAAGSQYVPWQAGKEYWFCARANTAMGAGTIQLSWYVAGAAQTLSVTLNVAAGTTQVCDILPSHMVSQADGDEVCIQAVASATASAVAVSWSLVHQPSVIGSTIVSGIRDAVGVNNGAGVSYSSFTGNTGGISGPTPRVNTVMGAGKLTNMRVVSSASIGVSNSIVFATEQNGAGTTLTCTIAASTSSCTDLFASTGHSYSLTAGDIIDMTRNFTIGGANPQVAFGYSATFTPTIPGQFILASSDNNSSLAAGVTYLGITGRQNGASATEAPVQQTTSAAFYSVGLYAFFQTAPAAGKSIAFLLDSATATATNTTCTVSGTNTSCGNAGLSFTSFIPAGGTLAIKSTPSGSPTAQGTASLSILGFISPLTGVL